VTDGWRLRPAAAAWATRITLVPELNLLVFAFLLHFPLELWIMEPKLPADPHIVERGEVTAVCGTAAAGHAVIALLTFWLIAGAGKRSWVHRPHWAETLMFVLCSGVFTLLAEPGLGMMLERASPHADTFANVWGGGRVLPSVLQAFAVPALLVWILGRQLRSTAEATAAHTAPVDSADEHVPSGFPG
jgi:hypothetical protein